MTRDEHLAFCKQRANEYLDVGEVEQAFNSMASDLAKHPKTQHLTELMPLGMIELQRRDIPGMRRFIEGFH